MSDRLTVKIEGEPKIFIVIGVNVHVMVSGLEIPRKEPVSLLKHLRSKVLNLNLTKEELTRA